MSRQTLLLDALLTHLLTAPAGGWGVTYTRQRGYVDTQQLTGLTSPKLWCYVDTTQPLGRAGAKRNTQCVVSVILAAPIVGTGAIPLDTLSAWQEQVQDQLLQFDGSSGRCETVISGPPHEPDLLRTPAVYVATLIADCEVLS